MAEHLMSDLSERLDGTFQGATRCRAARQPYDYPALGPALRVTGSGEGAQSRYHGTLICGLADSLCRDGLRPSRKPGKKPHGAFDTLLQESAKDIFLRTTRNCIDCECEQ